MLLSGLVFALVATTTIVVPSPADAASQGSGFGTWAPISAHGWHGSMIVNGVHTYCITPGAPAPTGESADHGVSGSAAGLSPQQLTGINLLVTKYGQTGDAVQAAAVGWAVKAIANWDETLGAFGYPGDSLAGAIHWTFSALAPEDDLAVQERAVAYYDEAMRTQTGVASASGSLVFTTDAADSSAGTVRVDATVAATGTITLVGARFADTGTEVRESASTGVSYAIRTTPPDAGRPYRVSGTGQFVAGPAAAVRYFTTAGGQDTAGPAGDMRFEVAGADAAPRFPPFTPEITTAVAARYAAGGPYVDDVTFVVDPQTWPRGDDGAQLPVTARANVYRTDAEPVAGAPLPADSEIAGTLELVADAGPSSAYRVTSPWEMSLPGFYTAVWRIDGSDQTEAVAAHTRRDYAWLEAFGERSQVVVVPAITTSAQPVAPTGETLSDTVLVTGGVPADGLRLVAAMYRAVDGTAPADTCVPENLVWESAPLDIAQTGSFVFTSPPVADRGTYYWQERAADAQGATVHVGVCGIENETSRVVEAFPPDTEQPERPARAALASSGATPGAVRGAASVAVLLLTLGTSALLARRTPTARRIRFGQRPGIR